MRSTTLRVLVLVFVLAFVTAMPLASAADVVIKFAHVHGDPQAAEWKKAITVFEQKNPGIKVEYEIISWPGDDQLRARALGGALPDVFYLAPWSIWPFAQAGWIADVAPYMKRDGVKLTDFIGPRVLSTDAQGHVWALPYDTNGFFIQYNMDHFNNAGLGIPAANWNYSDFSQIMRKLTVDRNGDGKMEQYGLSGIHSSWFSEVYLANFGASFLANGAISANTPEMRKGLEYWRDQISRGLLGPGTWDNGVEKFIRGESSMTFADSGWVSTTTQQIKSDWGTAMLPVEPGVTRQSVAFSGLFVMSNQSKHPEEVWKFFNFITSAQAQAMRATAGMFPAQPSAGRTWIDYITTGSKNSGQHAPIGIENVIKSAEMAHEPSYIGAKFLQYDAEIDKNLRAFYDGKIAVTQAINNIETGMRAVMSK